MRTIRISDEVWNALAERGKFGETPDDVLRRVFNIAPIDKANMRRRMTAKRKMTARVDDGHLLISFIDGPSKMWPLPLRDNKGELRLVRDIAIAFAEQHGATEGQIKALIKALTSEGYHLTK